MTLIKKIDVKNYLSYPKRNGFRLHRPASQPDATGFSGETGSTDSNASHIVEATSNQSSSSGTDTPRTKTQPASGPIAVPAKLKSARA